MMLHLVVERKLFHVELTNESDISACRLLRHSEVLCTQTVDIVCDLSKIYNFINLCIVLCFAIKVSSWSPLNKTGEDVMESVQNVCASVG